MHLLIEPKAWHSPSILPRGGKMLHNLWKRTPEANWQPSMHESIG
jgi:hypothetical protein